MYIMTQYTHIYLYMMPFIRFGDSGVTITNFKMYKWYWRLREGGGRVEAGRQVGGYCSNSERYKGGFG